MENNIFVRETETFDVHHRHITDCAGDGCATIDVSRNERGHEVRSLWHLRDEIAKRMDQFNDCTKLYVLGEWMFSFDAIDPIEKDPDGGRIITHEEKEWNEGVALIKTVIKSMSNLQELTWSSTLPFMESIWSALPTTVTKLVLDVGYPIRLDADDSNRPIYLNQESMRPLINYTKLTELRIFGMRDTYQSTIWETVYRNEVENGNMRVLELQMAAPPLVRHEGWNKAKDVQGLRVDLEESRPYRGNVGKGTLHHELGFGEYLDDLCMRKARLAAGLDETKPLPLWCLKLDGFVVDNLPFELELSYIVLLVCGDMCIDAGLRAPKTSSPRNVWNGIVKNATTHCMIDWPLWAGVFDAQGRQLDAEGMVIEEEEPRGRRRSRNRYVGIREKITATLPRNDERFRPVDLDGTKKPLGTVSRLERQKTTDSTDDTHKEVNTLDAVQPRLEALSMTSAVSTRGDSPVPGSSDSFTWLSSASDMKDSYFTLDSLTESEPSPERQAVDTTSVTATLDSAKPTPGELTSYNLNTRSSERTSET
ncbi:hypothetical protein K491DRAFT_717410 [Lophiostoma macrostomum CBS 122681]|uniref:Uncharacterized protein n=1 Tax=Lophiostoma macrostomum CBS 122681 TaxID=1314788 RepID=A0A6A6T5D9_9PLEO|nr:hypothetical protein K491DRAFT_717410 [Lophiostoma macrostomum CBS 122681]